MNYRGLLIRRERLRRNWSQEGLCRGICTVSYLSKIEQGKAEPSGEVLRLLMERLELDRNGENEARAAELAERAGEKLFSGDVEGFRALLPELGEERLLHTGAGLDLMLLLRLEDGESGPLDAELESCMDSRQLALQRLLQGRHEEALRLWPCGYTYFCAGAAAHDRGESYPQALEYLQTGYELAAREGMVHLMLHCRTLMGNCYCNLLDLDNMAAHYRVAERLARALGDGKTLEVIRYNTASSQLETGDYPAAYAYFSSLREESVMSLHKLAICCEKLGRTREGLEALDRADELESEYPDAALARQMCALVRFRLEREDYRKCAEYGALLLDCFRRCRERLPIGYAAFHLPWVLEWYTAQRQYRKAFELLQEFPLKLDIKGI